MKYFTDTTGKKPCHIRLFESPLDMARAGVHEHNTRKDKRYTTGNMVKSSGWLTRPIESANDYATLFSGTNPVARKKIEEEVARIRREEDIPTPEEVRRVPAWEEDEGEIDMDRAFNGDETCFRNRRKAKRVTTKNVVIVYNAWVNCGVRERDAMKVGAGVAAAIEILEEAGYSVELWVVCAATGATKDGDDMYSGCRVKESGEPLNTDTMSNCFSPDFIRVPAFGLMSSVPGGHDHCHGFGDDKLNVRMQPHLQLDGINVIQATCLRDHYPVNGVDQAKRIIREATEA